MSGSVRETEDEIQSKDPQETAIDEVEDAMKRLRISPRKVLASLPHLRIDRARIKPIEGQVSKAGGKADVEAAILTSAPFSTPSESDDAEYVAVKKLRLDEDTHDDRALAPLAHEVNLLNNLSHKSVVRLVGFVEEVEQGVAWMVFAWEKNGNLREFIRSAKWELPERISLIDDVARGLRYLHERNPPICHGDLKSLNILINSMHRAMITDFGSARAVGLVDERALKGVGASKASLTSRPDAMLAQDVKAPSADIAPSGDFITMTGPAWSVRWAAPELLEGCLPGLASDIWALGWICWETVTGNFPFHKENDIAVVLRIVKGDLPPLENDDQLRQIKALCSLMRECWKLDIRERPTALRCQTVVHWMDQTAPSRREGNSSTVARSSGLLYALGRVQLRNNMYTKAQGYFEQSLEAAASAGDQLGEARAYQAFGDVAYLQNEYSKAEGSFIQAREIYSQIDNEQGIAQSVKRLGDVYSLRAEYSKAEEACIQARTIYSQMGDQLGLAESTKSLGHVYSMRAEYSKAEDSYILSRTIYSQIGDQLGLAHSVNGLGDVYRMRAEYSKAEESYIQTREIYSQIGDQLGSTRSIKNLADVHYMRGKYSEAEGSYIQAREIYAQIGSQLGFAQSVRSLGDVYRMRAEYSKAEESYTQAREIYSQIGDQMGLVQAVRSLGAVYLMRNEYSNAEEAYIQARNVSSEIGNQVDLAHSFEGLGRVHKARREYAKAEASYSEAQRIYRLIGDRRSLADISWYWGWLYREQAQYGEADRLVREASAIYNELGLTEDVKDCDKFLVDIRALM